MKLIKRLIAWLNEPTRLGCPYPELHDRNSEARHCDVISASINADGVGGSCDR